MRSDVAELAPDFPEGFTWDLEREMGHYPVTLHPYDSDYFEKYVGYAETEMGRRITEERVGLVSRFHHGFLLDVGIGSGAFIEARPWTRGFDINPRAVAWLKDRDLWRDPADGELVAVSLWDVIEHIPEPRDLLDRVSKWVFCCLPIFDGPYHVLRSKHFRTDEHVHYWTLSGFIRYLGEAGFGCVWHGTPEIVLGREDIHTFVFRRVDR